MTNHTIQGSMGKLRDGISVISYDEAGQPMINVNRTELLSILMDREKHDLREKRSVFYPNSLWPNGVVPYVFDKRVGDVAKKAILLGFKMIMERVPCIRYIPATDADLEQGYVLFTPEGECCSSKYKGFQPGVVNPIMMYEGCVRNSKDGIPTFVIRVLMHSLGVAYEVQRYDRDDYIQIRLDRVKPARIDDYIKLDEEMAEGEYDYNSIQQISQFENIKPSYEEVKNNVDWKLDYELEENWVQKRLPKGYLGFNKAMSKSDYMGLRNRYGCPGELPSDRKYNRGVEMDRRRAERLSKRRRAFSRLEREATKGMTDKQKQDRKEVKRKAGEYFEKYHEAREAGNYLLAAQVKKDYDASGNWEILDGINLEMEKLEKTYKPPMYWEEEGDPIKIFQRDREEEQRVQNEQLAKLKEEFRLNAIKRREEHYKNLPRIKAEIEAKKKKQEEKQKEEQEEQEYWKKDNLQKEQEQRENERKEKERKEHEHRENQRKEEEGKENAQRENERQEKERKEHEHKENERKERERKENAQRENEQRENKIKKASVGQNKVQKQDDLIDTSNCVVTEWSKWSVCRKGQRARLRKIKQEAWSSACDNSGIQVFLKACSD